jgi:3-hydroxyacyl-CoA dehydrogenase
MYYKSILTAMAKVSTSGYEALTADFTKGKDIIVVNKDRQIAEAKHALLMAEAGHTQPIHRTDVKVLGKQAGYVLSRN